MVLLERLNLFSYSQKPSLCIGDIIYGNLNVSTIKISDFCMRSRLESCKTDVFNLSLSFVQQSD